MTYHPEPVYSYAEGFDGSGLGMGTAWTRVTAARATTMWVGKCMLAVFP